MHPPLPTRFAQARSAQAQPAQVHPAPSAGPITPEHLAAFAQAKVRMKKIRRAAAVAATNGWTMGFFGVITLVVAVFGPLLGDGVSIPALLLGAGLTAAAVTEVRGAARLKRLDPSVPRALAMNQGLIAAAVAGYCAWTIYSTFGGPNPALAAAGGSTGDAQYDETIAGIGAMYNSIARIAYGAVILATLMTEALLAWYYLSRRRHIEGFIAETPDWLLTLQRSGSLA